ncbi:NAD(P)-dependent dehydrogenase (short-subunit alcohol dehydrogenase family) [Georgenia soli]|uniref:NAD(P)-dependent dehydrogenase (Short-subunit alcohol dehydrogenase family) n=1 Tax=Georgenia soli TaxID=638953 RepID=A0A2A9ERC5_9MICO|nr:SDR family oxidoreductase [Georgenia soli]PFG41081.1 NAD(P)-dependent dehydrogenase (short-subunit alcohol dehydrogenase family) [Georgenia soli]
MTDHTAPPASAARPRTLVVTGAETPIGADLVVLLRSAGDRVITCGRGDAVDVRADLSTARGRASLVAAVERLAADGLDGAALVAEVDEPGPPSVAVNYFGTITVLDGLRPLLARRPAPRATVVTSAAALSAGDLEIVDACLAGEEASARAAAGAAVVQGRGSVVYRSTKIALNRWVRRQAAEARWAGAGITLNAVAPGVVESPASGEAPAGSAVQAQYVALALPQPLGTAGPVRAVTSAIAWTLAEENAFMTGQVLFVDGGTDAVLRGEGPYEDGVRHSPAALGRMLFRAAVERLRR